MPVAHPAGNSSGVLDGAGAILLASPDCARALGHPIGATGSLLIGTVLDELQRRDQQFGLVTMCAAGGMAPAIVIERI
jgi:acetyl-CoA acetyltransferase